MKTIDNIKKRIIISMISILLLIITLFGITYAYFVSKVKGNTSDKSVSVKAGKLELTYEDGNGVLEVGEYLQPGEKVKFKDSKGNIVESKIFTVTNTGTGRVSSYEVVLQNLINELEYYEDLTYTLTCTSYINYGEETQEEFGSCNGSNGYFPKTTGILNSNSIDVDVTHYYVLTMEYAETHQDQSIDMKKNISAKINIQDNESSLNKLIVYGNSIQDGTPSIDNPIEIQSVGEKTKNLLVYPYKFGTRTINGITFTDNGDGSITVDGTSTDATTYYLFQDLNNLMPGLNIGDTFTISKNPNDSSQQDSVYFIFNYYNDSGTMITGAIASYRLTDTREIPVEAVGSGIYLHVPKDKTINNLTLKPMIEYGNITHDYEPYTKSKYKIPLKVTGKNLLKTIGVNSWGNYSIETNSDSSGPLTTDIIQNYINSGSAKYNGYAYYGNNSNAHYITLKPNTTYIYGIEYINDKDTDSTSALNLAAYKYNQGTGAYHFFHYASSPSKNFVSTSNTNYSGYYKFTTNDTDLIYGFSTAGGIIGTGSKIVKYKLYLYEVKDENNINSKYFKYKEPLVSNIYLDEPLRKVGNYVDYIDFMNYRLVRNVGVSDDSGTKPLEESLYGLLRPIQTNIALPTLIKEDIGNIEILTDVEPSKIEY